MGSAVGAIEPPPSSVAASATGVAEEEDDDELHAASAATPIDNKGTSADRIFACHSHAACDWMRPVRAPSRIILVGACAVLASCSDGGVITLGPSATDAGDAATADASAPLDSGAETSTTGECGPGPWVDIGLVVTALSASTTTTPLLGATFTTPLCPGVSRTSDAMGNIQGKLAKSTPFYGRLQAKGYADMLTPEQKYDADTSGVKISMLPSIFTALIPGFASDKTVVFIGAQKNGGTGECDKLDGIVFSVPGHPEAVVTYYSADAIPAAVPGATSTTTSGRASIGGLAAGAPVAVSGAKPSCVVETIHGPNTGRAPLEVGFVSILGAWVSGP